MSSQPLVSQIIPVYVRDEENIHYFGEGLESILAQTYENIEILIVNDGSPLTKELEAFLQPYESRIRYIKKENGGVATALNKGIEEMKGDYFSWLSHDDWFYPTKIATQIEQIQKEDGNTILYCDVEHVDNKLEHLSFEYVPDLDRKTYRWIASMSR